MDKFKAMVRANVHYLFDPAWQNPDGTLKLLTREELKALTPEQRKERWKAQAREYSRRRRARQAPPSLEERRARSERLRAQRIAAEKAAQEAKEREVRSEIHPAFPAPPGASVDLEIRRRIVLMNVLGRRPSCGIF